MNSRKLLFVLLSFLIFNCEETIIYETNEVIDPRFFNDAFHGNITGKIVQKNSSPLIIVSQVKDIDTVLINTSDGSFAFENLPIGNYDLRIIADNFRIYKQYNVFVNGAGTTYLGEIDLLKIPDLISTYYPEDNEEIVFNNRYSALSISVTFTQPMDRASVEAAFKTEPASEGIFSWGNYSRSPYDYYFADAAYSDPNLSEYGATITTYSKITSFTYRMAQKDSYVDTTYRVIISTEAKDTSGNHLRFPLEFSFRTIQSSSTVNGFQTLPYHGDINVEPVSRNGIEILFPRNMNKQSVEKNISVSPGNNITYIWPALNKLTIYTGGVFYSETKYTITIDSTAEDLDGKKLKNPFTFSFETDKVRVTSTTPSNGEVFVFKENDLYINFNTYVVKSSVEKAIKITPTTQGYFSYDSYSSSSRIRFDPATSWKPNTKYTITIDTSAVDLYGAHLKEPYEFSFITRPD